MGSVKDIKLPDNRSFDLVAFGELLYALRAPYTTLLEQTRTLNCHCTGAEANVSVGVSRFGLKTSFLTKVCDNFIGRFAVDTLRRCGIDTSSIALAKEGRMGTLYQEYGIPPRQSHNVYDRLSTSFLTLTEDELDFSVLEKARAFYTSGVTAALGERPRKLALRLMREAGDVGTVRIFDCNFRSNLWTAKQATDFFKVILSEVDICFIKADDAKELLNIDGSPEQLLNKIRNKYDIDLIVMTLGSEGAMAFDGQQSYYHPAFEVDLINRFGMGDAFIAGFLCGVFKENIPRALSYAAASAALKGTYTDESFVQFGLKDIERLVGAAKNNNTIGQGQIRR